MGTICVLPIQVGMSIIYAYTHSSGDQHVIKFNMDNWNNSGTASQHAVKFVPLTVMQLFQQSRLFDDDSLERI